MRKKDVVMNTIIGRGAECSSDFSAEGSVRIDGCANGNVTITGNLIVGATGVIHGDVAADGDAAFYKAVLADVAALADPGAGHDVGAGPDPGAGSDLAALVHDAHGMGVKCLLFHRSFSSSVLMMKSRSSASSSGNTGMAKEVAASCSVTGRSPVR